MGLSAFYLLPLLFAGKRSLIRMQPDQFYSPVTFDVLFKQVYPGPHFVVLSLAGILLLAVLIVRGENRDSYYGDETRIDDRLRETSDAKRYWHRNRLTLNAIRNIFYLFAGLTILFLIYSLYPKPQTLNPNLVYLITLFAVITIALGCSYLGKEAVSSRILFVAVAALTAISLQNTKTLAVHRFQHPSSLDAPIDPGMFDTTKQFRVYHPKLDERFLLYKEYGLWFAQGIGYSQTLNPNTFYFDWLGVREAYIYNARIGGGEEVNKDFDNDNFEKRGDYAIYKRATPIVYATNSQPVLFYAKDEEAHQEQISDLASKGLSLERVIPIRTKRWIDDAKIPIVSFVSDLKKECKKCFDSVKVDNENQTMSYQRPTQWEISLGKQFRGVVFKQTYDRNWKAVLLVDGKKEESLRVFEAGPAFAKASAGESGMMYVFLPKYNSPVKVTFTYQQSLSEKMGWFITFGTILSFPLLHLAKFDKVMLFFKRKAQIAKRKIINQN